MSHRSEAHKIYFLLNATVGLYWATEPLSLVATHNLSLQKLCGKLEAALLLSRDEKLANVRDNISRLRKIDDEDEQIP